MYPTTWPASNDKSWLARTHAVHIAAQPQAQVNSPPPPSHSVSRCTCRAVSSYITPRVYIIRCLAHVDTSPNTWIPPGPARFPTTPYAAKGSSCSYGEGSDTGAAAPDAPNKSSSGSREPLGAPPGEGIGGPPAAAAALPAPRRSPSTAVPPIGAVGGRGDAGG